MIINSNIVAYKYITSAKTGQEFCKVWVNVPPADCQGEPVESMVIPRPGHDIGVGDKCVVSVDRFGKLNDIQL